MSLYQDTIYALYIIRYFEMFVLVFCNTSLRTFIIIFFVLQHEQIQKEKKEDQHSYLPFYHFLMMLKPVKHSQKSISEIQNHWLKTD